MDTSVNWKPLQSLETGHVEKVIIVLRVWNTNVRTELILRHLDLFQKVNVKCAPLVRSAQITSQKLRIAFALGRIVPITLRKSRIVKLDTTVFMAYTKKIWWIFVHVGITAQQGQDSL